MEIGIDEKYEQYNWEKKSQISPSLVEEVVIHRLCIGVARFCIGFVSDLHKIRIGYARRIVCFA